MLSDMFLYIYNNEFVIQLDKDTNNDITMTWYDVIKKIDYSVVFSLNDFIEEYHLVEENAYEIFKLTFEKKTGHTCNIKKRNHRELDLEFMIDLYYIQIEIELTLIAEEKSNNEDLISLYEEEKETSREYYEKWIDACNIIDELENSDNYPKDKIRQYKVAVDHYMEEKLTELEFENLRLKKIIQNLQNKN